ncbi:MAG: magnesium/cobalt transporter CorA [Candidatus Heimdallarchaeota archaeon]
MGLLRKTQLIKRRTKKLGLPPGSPVFVGRKKTDKTTLTLLRYDKDNSEEIGLDEIREVTRYEEQRKVFWINIDGLHDIRVIGEIGNTFSIDPLLIEDILNTDQRPKLDEYTETIFITVKTLDYLPEYDAITVEQISMVLTKNYVLTFLEAPNELFDPIKNRIKSYKGKIRHSGSDYLFYSLLDLIVDKYFVVLEKLSNRIERLETDLISNPNTETLHTIYDLKTNLLHLRRAVWPLRDVVSRLERAGSNLIQTNTRRYVRDIYDHTIQIIETLEILRDMINGMMEIYLSSTSNRMNEIMKVLTIIATITIPLTVISGIYGMNFRYMPELEWIFGYPLALLLMLIVVITMITYFRTKKWF